MPDTLLLHVRLKQFRLKHINIDKYAILGNILGESTESQLAIGAPRAGSNRTGSVFVVKHTSGQENVEHVGILRGKKRHNNFLKIKIDLKLFAE